MTEQRDTLDLTDAYGCDVISGPASTRRIEFNERGGFPFVAGDTHTAEYVWFYEDCIKDKIFVVNFMSIRDEKNSKVTANLAKTVKLLGDRVGREIFVTSITMDPQHDTVGRLADFAWEHKAPHGWRFLRLSPVDAGLLSRRLYHFNRSGVMTRLVFYGNGKANLWGSYPALIRPEDAANRITWVIPKKKPATPRRAGPARLGHNPNPWNNRAI